MANPDHELMLRKAVATGAADADFSGCDLSGLRFPSAKLGGMQLCGANFRRADLSGAYLQAADLSDANLAQARLTFADLREASLRGASLKSADLSAAVLQGVDLREADLAKCKLTRCMLGGADLTDADLSNADLRGVRGATAEQIRGSKNWNKAIFDAPMAKLLGVIQDAEASRHGAKPAGKAGKRRSIAVDILFAAVRPTFGDLFTITGDIHPRFPPSGNFDLAALADVGFQQTDDFFALVDTDGDPIIWLYPLIDGKPVCHHEGPFDGVRLELSRVTKATAPRFIEAVAAFAETLEGAIFEVVGEKPAAAITLGELRKRIENR